MRIFIFLVLGLLSLHVSYSQENYIEGYIIKPNNDTINGFVDYRNWANNPDMVKFKTSIDSNPISFKPTDILEFGVQDEIYISATINVDITSTKTEKLDDDAEIKTKTKTTYLQTLFRGDENKGLYYFISSNGRRNFYIKIGNKFELLLYKKYFSFREGKKHIVENKKYLGQLALYLNDCPTIQTKFRNTSYSPKSLSKLFQKYFECSSGNISFKNKTEKIVIEIGGLVGASSTTLEFMTSDYFAYLENTDYNQSTNFAAGLFFDMVLPRNNGKWSFNNELLYTMYDVKGTSEDYRNEDSYTITTTEIGYSYLKINSLFRYKYPIGSAFLFFNGGMSNGFAIRETNYSKTISKFYNDERMAEDIALSSRKYEQGFVLGAGIKYKRYSLEVRAEKANGMANNTSIRSMTNRYYLLLGYKF